MHPADVRRAYGAKQMDTSVEWQSKFRGDMFRTPFFNTYFVRCADERRCVEDDFSTPRSNSGELEGKEMSEQDGKGLQDLQVCLN